MVFYSRELNEAPCYLWNYIRIVLWSYVYGKLHILFSKQAMNVTMWTMRCRRGETHVLNGPRKLRAANNSLKPRLLVSYSFHVVQDKKTNLRRKRDSHLPS